MIIVLNTGPDLDADLAEALDRILDNRTCPKYLTQAAQPWLDHQREGTR